MLWHASCSLDTKHGQGGPGRERCSTGRLPVGAESSCSFSDPPMPVTNENRIPPLDERIWEEHLMSIRQTAVRWLTVVFMAAVPMRATADDVIHVGYQNACMIEKSDVGSFFDPDIWYGFTLPGPGASVLFGSGFDPDGDGLNPHTLHLGDFCRDIADCPGPLSFPAGQAQAALMWFDSEDWVIDARAGRVGTCDPPGDASGDLVAGWLYVGAFPETDAGLTLREGRMSIDQVGVGVEGGVGRLTLDEAELSFEELRAGSGAAPFSSTLTLVGDRAAALQRSALDTQIGGGDGVSDSILTIMDNARASFLGSVFLSRGQGDGHVQIVSGGRMDVGGSLLIAGGESASLGSVYVQGGRLAVAQDAVFGWAGAGPVATLTINADGHVASATACVGSVETSRGIAALNGPNTEWAVDSTLLVGDAGDGQITMSHGAVLTAVSSVLGRVATGYATMTLSDAETRFTVSDLLIIGGEGRAQLFSQADATVQARRMVLGEQLLGDGALVAEGSGCTINAMDSIIVGELGSGAVELQTGARAHVGIGVFGDHEGATGHLMLEDAGSQWDSAEELTIGNEGDAHVVVVNGAHLSSRSVIAAATPVSRADIDVSGADARIESVSVIGSGGYARLALSRGGEASSADLVTRQPRDAFIGIGDGAVGNVTLTDANTRWTGIDFLTVGGVYHTDTRGVGTLVVRHGGRVESNWGVLGEGHSRGDVLVEGAGARWAIGGPLLCGTQGTGAITIRAGGTVQCTSAVLGVDEPAVGTITVQEASSVLAVADELRVGADGHGELTMLEGGVVDAPVTFIGRQGSAGGAGVVEGSVDNAGLAAPGAPIGRLDVLGAWRQSADGRLAIELGGNAPEQGYDVLSVQGPVDLDGSLVVALLNGFVPRHGDRFEVLTFAGRSGEFASIDGPDLGDLRLDARYSDASLTLMVVADVDCDHIQSFSAACDGGKLRVKLKAQLAVGTELLVDNNGDQRPVTLNERGKGKVVYKRQSGAHAVTLVDCQRPPLDVVCE